MTTSRIAVATPKGEMDTEIITPEGTGPFPAVIVCFDAGGTRAAISEIGERIAKQGYVVAIPDLYHRVGKLSDFLPAGKTIGDVFKDDALRARFTSTFYATATSYDVLREDVGALLKVLHARKDVADRKIATTGYCMGGNISLRIGTVFGDEIAATASFHGGGLVTPAPDSPHLRVGNLKSRVYVAGAIEDGTFPDAAKATLEKSLTDAKVAHTVETYPARHGFVVRDNGSYDAAAAARHDAALTSLFRETLQA
jgi:carboxymethylenebutenolidase